MFKSIMIILILCITFYLLYRQGYMLVNRKKAFIFVARLYGKNNWKADFSECSGYIKRMIRFDKGQYTFILNKQVSKGEVYIRLQDKDKNTLIDIHDYNKVFLDEDRYYLVYYFKDTSGKFEFSWHKE